MDAVDAFKQEREAMKLWTMHEAAQFLDMSRGHRLYALFYLAMSTGLRCGELLGLEWGDIKGNALSVRRSLIHVRGKLDISTHKTKKGERRVALSDDVLEVLDQHRQRQAAERTLLGEAWPRTELVFASVVGTWIHPRNLARTWHHLQGDAKVTRVRLHDLRHLHASIAIKEGMDAKVLADRLGHARASFTLDVYTHLFDEQRANSAVSIAHLMTKARAETPN